MWRIWSEGKGRKMEYLDDYMHEEGNRETRLTRSCRQVLAVYNALSRAEQNLIPPPLVQAICHYAGLEKTEDQEPAAYDDMLHLNQLSLGIMELLLFFSGTVSKKEAISRIRENVSKRDRQFIGEILLLKEKLEKEQKNGDGA